MMNRCKIKVYSDSSYLVINYLKNMNINIYDFKLFKDYILLVIDYSNINIIDNVFDYDIVTDYRLIGIIKFIRYHLYSYLVLIFCISLIILLTSYIISINVKVLNSGIRKKIYDDLSSIGIHKYVLRNDKNLDNIKDYLLSNNKDSIEWLNIYRVGMKYIIEIEVKKNKSKVIDSSYCNVIAKKDAIVTRIISSKGVNIVDVNDYVAKDSILISGDIKYNDINDKVCAKGIVYGKVWYSVKLSIPKYKIIKKEISNGKKNIIMRFGNKEFSLFKLKNYNFIKKKNIINKFGISVDYIKEIETDDIKYYFNSYELDQYIDKLIVEKFDKMINDRYTILKRNVLKKTDNNSKMDIEVFIVTEENIGVTLKE